MNTVRPISATLAALALAALALMLPSLAPALAASKPARRGATLPPAVRNSEQLWATIDVCNPADQPDTVGIRGSMPGDGQPHDSMFMHFRLQYLSPTSKHWLDLADGAENGFVALGPAKVARQIGWSFRLASGGPTFQLRGVVTYQWRHGTTVLYSLSRPTTAGHHSVTGADPPSFSSASCSLA